MTIPKITPIKVPAMPKPAAIPKVPAGIFNRAPEISGEQRPLGRFRPVKLDAPSHWSGH